jgi:hypothetical protein
MRSGPRPVNLRQVPRELPPEVAKAVVRGTRAAHDRLDPGTVAMLLGKRETLRRLAAGVPEGAAVDLSLVKRPADTLMFPNPPEVGQEFSLFDPAQPAQRHPGLCPARREHWMRAGAVPRPARRPLDRPARRRHTHPHGGPAHRRRPGDPMRNYAKLKRSKRADDKLSEAIAGLAAGFLKPDGSKLGPVSRSYRDLW